MGRGPRRRKEGIRSGRSFRDDLWATHGKEDGRNAEKISAAWGGGGPRME